MTHVPAAGRATARWVAVVAGTAALSGTAVCRSEIQVRQFPDSGENLTISTEGGNEPVWSRNGRELFYRSGDAMMAGSHDESRAEREQAATTVRTAL
jgi:hypothetical protein